MRSRSKQIISGVLAAMALLVLSACGDTRPQQTPTPAQTPSPSAAPPVETVQMPTEESPKENGPIPISALEEIQQELYEAICGVRQPETMEVSGLAWKDTPEIDIKNLYYQLTAQYPELKYAYDVSAAVDNGLLTCVISYMPYQTGEYPEGKEYLPVDSFEELIAAAEAHMGGEPVPIRMTDSTWTPDEVDHALAQAGGGYILCALNRDGTEITYTPAMGMEMEECLSALEEIEHLADGVFSEVVSDGMSKRDTAFALYSYVTSHVQYDQRYYTDREHMPYCSQTALGALRDGVAICGGYSHAVKILFERAGIPCYNMSGKYIQDNHMWNVAYLEGAWLWFDATIDRGSSGEYGFLRFALEELDPMKYHWDGDRIGMLLN